MYKNKRYRSSTLGGAQKQNSGPVSQSSRVLAPVDENLPENAKRARVDTDAQGDDLFSSQASVPASQPPTQRRYLSQRSTLRKTQSVTTAGRMPTSYFEMILIHSGVDLDQKDNLVLSCDDITFINQFNKILRKGKEEDKNAKIFLEGFKDVLNDKSAAIKFLSGYTIAVQETGTTMQSQISMTGNFLMVDVLQQGVTELLMDRIQFYAENDENDNGDIYILPLLLSHLRYASSLHGEFVYQKVVEIFQRATLRSKREIIANSEFILDPKKHDDFVMFLIENIPSKEELLNNTTVTTFAYLHITARVQGMLRRKILEYIREDCPKTLWPSFTKFLLEIATDEEDCLTKLISDLRNSLEFKEVKDDEEKNVQLEVFKHIKRSLMISKKLFEVWQKNLQSLSPLDFKPIDLLILLIMASIRQEKSLFLENIIRRRINNEQISVKIVAETKRVLFPVFESYANVFMDILEDFLKEKNFLVVEFAKQCIMIIFEVNETYQRKVLAKLVEMTSDRATSDVISPLEVLKELNETHPKELQHWGLLLLPLLDRINEMNLNQSRLIMKLLCSITYPLPPLPVCESLRDHLEKIVKKQVINRSIAIKNQGIIGTIQLIDHAIRIEESSVGNIYEMDDVTFHTISEIPNTRGKQMAYYVGLVMSAARNSPETLALFYDELACVFSPKRKGRCENFRIERNFFTWLLDLATHFFQKDFVVEDTPSGSGLDLEPQQCINAPEDSSASELIPIAINISEPVLKVPSEASLSVTVLAPLFNLVKTLHFIRYNGNLESINALLGCAIILPSFVGSSSDLDVFDEYNEVMVKKIMDIHFHTANWYREIIGSFASQNEPMYRRKVLIRLAELIDLEERIRILLAKAPTNYSTTAGNYLANVTGIAFQFKRPTVRAKGPKGKAQNAASTKNTNKNTQQKNASTQVKQRSTANFLSDYGPLENYRQMDPDIMLLLREELNTQFPFPSQNRGQAIGLLEFRFIMADLVNKMESISSNKNATSGQILQYVFEPVDFARSLVNQLQKIMGHYKKISESVISVSSRVKSDSDAELFTDELNYLKVCFGLCLRFFASLFTWPGFRNTSNQDMLKESLEAITRSSALGTTPESGLEDLASKALERFLNLGKHVIDLQSAVYLYQLTTALLKYVPEQVNFEKSIRDLCRSFLYRKWYNFDGTPEKGSTCNTLLNELLKGFFVNFSLKHLKDVTNVVLDEAKSLQQKNNYLRTFPNFYKLNFPVLFKEMCECLTTLTSDWSSKDLRIWEESCEILNTLLQIIKSMEVPRNFSLFLKHAHLYIKMFLQKGLPVIESLIRKFPERVNNLLKNLQITTRFLHHLCCHSKVIKHAGMISQIPALRETIESLVIRIRAALVANQCSSAFWMGNLRNKDLHGEEILSQTSSLITPNNDDSNDEMSDDESVDNTILDEENESSRNNPSGSKELHETSSRSICI